MFDVYRVNENDDIESIAKKYNTTSRVLKAINGNNIELMDGENILIPKSRNEFFDFYVINKGDTLYGIADNSNIDVGLIAMLNGLNVDDYIYPGQMLLIPRSGTIMYITANGDTLGEIASGIGTSVSELLTYNNRLYLQPEQLIVYRSK